MKTMSFVLAVFFNLFNVSQTRADDITSIDVVTIEGDLSIGTQAPNGWLLDKEAAKRVGVCATYFPNNKSFDTAPAIIYARVAGSGYSEEKGIDSLVKEMVDKFKPRSPQFAIEKKKDYKTSNGFNFKMVYFLEGPRPNNFEAVAYLTFKNRIFLAVYSAILKTDFIKYEKVFYDFLDKVSPYSSDLSPFSGRCLYPVEKIQ